jgi:hypothetical protein
MARKTTERETYRKSLTGAIARNKERHKERR